jgi:hypothetical protein
MKLFCCFSFAIVSIFHVAIGQPMANQTWILGSYGGTLNWLNGLSQIDFSKDSTKITEIEKPSMTLRSTYSVLCDSSGKVMMYTNGCEIFNKNHELMPNGKDINIGGWMHKTLCPTDAYRIGQGTLFIPQPNKKDDYLLIHLFVDKPNPSFPAAIELRSTRIDMSDGLGLVLEKNKLVLKDTFSYGKLVTCRHANGQDWWVLLGETGTNNIFYFLLDSTGISLHHKQSVGISTRLEDRLGQACFSPDGQWYARIDGNNELDVFRFDRCRGLLYDPHYIDLKIPETEFWGCGVAFSPNSRYLYASANFLYYQFDMQAPDIEKSKDLVGEWDGFIDFYATNFYQQQLAPDGRIYICSTSDTRYLHVVNSPDLPGKACDLRQHSITLPNLNSIGLPNNPNFRLGAAPPGYCDSLKLSVPGSQERSRLPRIWVAPNPTDERCVLTFNPLPNESLLLVYNTTGQKWHEAKVPLGQTSYEFITTVWPPGLYFVVLQLDHGKSSMTRLVVER